MQPPTPPRPVMDISAPHRRAGATAVPPAEPPVTPANTPPPAKPEERATPAPPLPVREAPASDEPEPPKTDEPEQPRNAEATEVASKPEAAAPVPAPAAKPHDKTPLPVGAIVGTVFVMLALSAASIVVYLKTQ